MLRMETAELDTLHTPPYPLPHSSCSHFLNPSKILFLKTALHSGLKTGNLKVDLKHILVFR